MTMIEQVARAMATAENDYDGDELVWMPYVGDARVAIAAMREPTRPMWAAGGNAVVGYKQRHHDKVTESVWTGMIDAALKENDGE